MSFKLFDTIEDMERMLQNNVPRLVIAAGKHICVVKQHQQLIAFENECPHLGEALSGGMINPFNKIICPLHAYRFDLKTGEEELQRCKPLKFIKVEINEENGVFLSLSETK